MQSKIHGNECLKAWGTECLRMLNEGHDVAHVKHWLKVQKAMARSSSIAQDPNDLD
jgi:hypothetical protein